MKRSRIKGFHKIAEDISDVWGHPHWLWLHALNGLEKFEQLLAAHAELNRRYPEEKNEADD